MTAHKLLDVTDARCMGCGDHRRCVHVLGHSDVYARTWPLCVVCIGRLSTMPFYPADFIALPADPPDDEWLDLRTAR